MRLTFAIALFISGEAICQPSAKHFLKFDSLAKRWDEGIPLGNGWLGALIWQKEDKIRLSLDRVDLWDDRPMPEIDKLKFDWVVQKHKLNQYDSVQRLGDEPYEKYAAPTKIPGAALEFKSNLLGDVVSNELNIITGLSSIRFSSGVVFNNYIHATKQVGYFGFENLAGISIIPALIIPGYNGGKAGTGNSVEGQGLERLGYPKGELTTTTNSIRYHQPTYDKHYYEVLIKWVNTRGKSLLGEWTITHDQRAELPDINIKLKETTYWPEHVQWWTDFWSRSSVNIPDEKLEKQYYMEMYKFGSVARANTPPISLQAVWTADNGNLPPWKGDFHHDLNTQLSYWPGYTGNHLDLTAGFTNWLWKVRGENMRWTKQYFGTDGLNVPGVTTISGREMGGWIQYSMSPTTAAWLAQHFYWQTKFDPTDSAAKREAKWYITEVKKYLDQLRKRSDSNMLPLSSSPEYHNNSRAAWFTSITNYDLSLIKALDRMAFDLDAKRNSTHTLPDYDVNETGLTIAHGQNLDESHRHHAQLMPIYPLGLMDIENSRDSLIIKKSLRHLEKIGTKAWCGYSFSWIACVYARAKESDNAVRALKIFESNFCSPNSFHLNGDQRGGEHSSFTYRPFTLEGNFAFAQGIHELLIQSYKGYIEIFPAVPVSWKDVNFQSLRTEGGFLVSATRTNAVVQSVTIRATAGGNLRINLPFRKFLLSPVNKNIYVDNDITHIAMKAGEVIVIKNDDQQ
ncbi:MAG: hypothetical protein H7Y31_07115 [Chitinophagaceae bacterium]|nr:hypothetical protein [Chitinophagaceae bacterium]